MSYVDWCHKHGDYKGDYCGDCIDATEAELTLTKDMLNSVDLHNQELVAKLKKTEGENARLREAINHLLTWLEDREAYEAKHFPHDPSPTQIARAALEEK